MLQAARAFSEGCKFHIKGIRFAFGHLSFLVLSILPFLITLALYILAFYIFTLYADDLLRTVWHIETGQSSRYVGWLYSAYMYVVKFFLYLIVLVIMFYTFIVFSNIVASPIYDYICTRYQRLCRHGDGTVQGVSPVKGILKSMIQEAKKAVFILAAPLLLIFIPVVGALLGFVVAAVFIAWDYVDFPLSRDCPLLKDRIKVLWRYKFFLVGFGCPLLIPFLGLMIMPFAILGSMNLYFDKIKGNNYDFGTPTD
ncbi:MAG: EI24 domain-containing protein [Desulfobacterales bacterium]|nr:EI24 domain-containing protein [Desulfobacterales bacterium]